MSYLPPAIILNLALALFALIGSSVHLAHASVAIPSNEAENSAGARNSGSPPAGPLPDIDVEATCSNDGSSGTCSQHMNDFGTEKGSDEDKKDNTKEEYAEGYYIDKFFDSPRVRANTCQDLSEECPALAQQGMCMDDPEYMEEEMGCNKSCLFCISSESRELFSTGVPQLFEIDQAESNTNGDSESQQSEAPNHSKPKTKVHESITPTRAEILDIIETTEMYFAKVVLRNETYKYVRVSCRNYHEYCAIWAAQGKCDTNRGWMGSKCPAACLDCFMIDWDVRCPVDYDSNIFGPGDLNKMFERIVKEAGIDPKGVEPLEGDHPLGHLSVIVSPYHDMKNFLDEDDLENAEDYSPLPWVISIDNFLNEEECELLIELGAKEGYMRSTAYSGEINIDGTSDGIESTGRTSTNAWCRKECSNDPIVKRIIERMERVTGIPNENYEYLQLVRYEEGQFYENHHDYAPNQLYSMFGPRVLTFFLYLNDVESGGGTKFHDLGYTSEPERGKALIWPSVTDDDVDEIDEWTFHEALPVSSGVKFGANAWIHLRNIQNVPGFCKEGL